MPYSSRSDSELNAVSMIDGKKRDLLERLWEDCLALEIEDKAAGRPPTTLLGKRLRIE